MNILKVWHTRWRKKDTLVFFKLGILEHVTKSHSMSTSILFIFYGCSSNFRSIFSFFMLHQIASLAIFSFFVPCQMAPFIILYRFSIYSFG